MQNLLEQIESVILGNSPALSFKDPEALGLVRTIGALTPREIYQVGALTIQIILDHQLASAHAEREIHLMRDNSKPLC